MTMANIIYSPAPVNVGAIIAPTITIDRRPDPVNPATDPALLPTVPSGATLLPQANIASTTVIPPSANANVFVQPPAYLTVNEDGNVTVRQVVTLNFLGAGVTVTGNTKTANITISGGGGNGTPGGSNTQVQFNDAGVFGGNANFLFFRDTGGLQTAGNVFPHANAEHNLGSPIYRWNTLFATSANVSNNVNVLGNIIVSRNITATGDFSANNATIGNITTSHNVYANVGTFYGDQYSDGAIYVGTPAGTVLGSDVVMQITANAGGYSQTNFQNINSGNTASGDYILTADNGNDVTHYLDLGMTSSGWDGSETNVLSGLGPDHGYLYVQDGNLSLGTRSGNTSYGWKFDTTGNLTLPGNAFSVNYANGTQVSLGGGGSSTSIENGTSNVLIATANGNVTVTAAGSQTWTFDTTGNLTVPGSIVGSGTIIIDNRATGNTADIQLLSADDILIQGGNRAPGEGPEGGDINIYAGAGGAGDTGESTGGGDIQIYGGTGGAAGASDVGAAGGSIDIRSGAGGAADAVNGNAAGAGAVIIIRSGDAGINNGNTFLGANGGEITLTAGNTTSEGAYGANITLNAGGGGPNGIAGSVLIGLPPSDLASGGTWIFDGSGEVLSAPANAAISAATGNISLSSLSNTILSAFDLNTFTNYQMVLNNTGNVSMPGNVNVSGTIVQTPVALANLTATAGARAFVNNANLIAAGNFGAQIDGSGSNTVPVWSDGANWYIG